VGGTFAVALVLVVKVLMLPYDDEPSQEPEEDSS
jgi:hypothetical protein